MLNVINAEWIKLRSTKSLWWTTALILFFSIAMAMLMGYTSGSTLSNPELDAESKAAMLGLLSPDVAMSGFTAFGLMIVLIQAILMVTSEYGSGTQKVSLISTPQRWKQPLAKFIVYGVITAVVALISAVVSIWMMKVMFAGQVDDQSLLDMAGFSADHVWDYVGRTVLYAVLCVMIAIGTAYLIRHTAGAIAALLLWKLVIETAVVTMIPKIKDHLPQWMPFANMDSYSARMDHPDVVWQDSLGQTGSMLYFALWCVVIFAAGMIVLKKRDA